MRSRPASASVKAEGRRSRRAEATLKASLVEPPGRTRALPFALESRRFGVEVRVGSRLEGLDANPLRRALQAMGHRRGGMRPPPTRLFARESPRSKV